jgi:hypothetical protein
MRGEVRCADTMVAAVLVLVFFLYSATRELEFEGAYQHKQNINNVFKGVTDPPIPHTNALSRSKGSTFHSREKERMKLVIAITILTCNAACDDLPSPPSSLFRLRCPPPRPRFRLVSSPGEFEDSRRRAWRSGV